MNDTPYRITKVEIRASAWFEDGQWFARVDFYFAGKPVGRPRIYRDRPQMNSPHAMALATALAAELDGQRVA